MNRRTLLRAAAFAPLTTIGPAFGQTRWPDQVLRIVVPFVPGSFTDLSPDGYTLLLTDTSPRAAHSQRRGRA
jgi:hypothetical protein